MEIKTHDKRNFRYRFAPPRRIEGDNHRLTEDQVTLLYWMHLLGGLLTTDIIFELSKVLGLYTEVRSLRRSLLVLYNHFELLDRPKFQRRGINPNSKNLAHRVSEKAERLLKFKGKWSEHVPRPYGAMEHQMAVSCSYASDFILARQRGIPIRLQHELCESVDKGIAIETSLGTLNPDYVFMVELNGKEVLIFREIDRATEPGHSSDTKRKSWGKTINQYDEVVGQGKPSEKKYKKHFGLSDKVGALVQVITVPDINSYEFVMQKKIARLIDEKYKGKCPFFCLHTTWAFGYDFDPPKMMPTLNKQWECVGYAPIQLINSEDSTTG